MWGLMGYFTREMGERGFDSFGVILVRCLTGGVFFAIAIILSDPGRFLIKLRDLWVFFGCGICSLLFFNACYFQAINMLSLSAAAILLYTAPCFVILLSALLFSERLNGIKLTAMLMAFAGCCFTSGITGGMGSVSIPALLCGLGAGFGYALYSIFSKLALQRGYDSLTINFYSCVLAFAGSGLLWGFREPVALAFTGENTGFCLVLGLVSFFLPYLLYTMGLSRMEAGRASVMASIEPVVATVVGCFVYNESLSIQALFGIVLVLSAIVLLNLKSADKPIT